MRGFVLHADPPFGEARQAGDVAGLQQTDAVGAERAGLRFQSGGAQFIQIGVAAAVAAIDAQDQRRMQVVGRADGFPLFRPVGLQALLQPARMGGAADRVAFQLGEQRLAFTLGAAQHGIQQALGPGFLQLVRAADRFANGGMRRNAGIEQLVQADEKQRLHIAIRRLERLLQQLLGQQRQARLPAGGAEGQLLHQSAITGFDALEQRRQAAAQRGAALQHRRQGLGGR